MGESVGLGWAVSTRDEWLAMKDVGKQMGFIVCIVRHVSLAGRKVVMKNCNMGIIHQKPCDDHHL